MLPVRMLVASRDQRQDSYLDSLEQQQGWPIGGVAFAGYRKDLGWGR